MGVETAFIETQAQADYAKNLDQFASQKFDVIIGVGFLMGDAVKAAAEKNPNIKYAIVDFAYDPAVTNVEGIVFAEDEAGYLAGVLAASMSKSGTIAVVGGVEGVPAVQKFVKGYTNGAKSVNADIQVKQVYIDSFTDRARGAEAAKGFIADGADAVSYTHLDVYKRQVTKSDIFPQTGKEPVRPAGSARLYLEAGVQHISDDTVSALIEGPVFVLTKAPASTANIYPLESAEFIITLGNATGAGDQINGQRREDAIPALNPVFVDSWPVGSELVAGCLLYTSRCV